MFWEKWGKGNYPPYLAPPLLEGVLFKVSEIREITREAFIWRGNIQFVALQKRACFENTLLRKNLDHLSKNNSHTICSFL